MSVEQCSVNCRIGRETWLGTDGKRERQQLRSGGGIET